MRLESVSICNFRGIRNLSIRLESHSALVGANNAGKSSVIDALRMFYDKDGYRFEFHRDFPKAADETCDSWIELTFRLSESENALLPETIRSANRKLKVRRWFHLSSVATSKSRKVGAVYSVLEDGSIAAKPIKGMESGPRDFLGRITYVPALSRIDDHLKLTGPSAMRDLVRLVVEAANSKAKSKTKISKALRVLTTALVGGPKTRKGMFDSLERELNAALSPWNAEFRVSVDGGNLESILKTILQWRILDKGSNAEIGITEFGSGFQRHLAASLVRLAAKKRRRPSAAERGRSLSFELMLFEEPEAFLHPSQQINLAGALRRMPQKGVQVLCSTHSQQFISSFAPDLASIVRLARVAGYTNAFQMSKSDWDEIIDSQLLMETVFGSSSPAKSSRQQGEAATTLEAVRYLSWMNGGRAALMFADMVLLVEGETERALIAQLIDDKRIDVGRNANTYVLDCLGKYNIHRFVALLSAFGIRHAILHDLDENRKRNAKINKFIRSQVNRTWTSAIGSFPSDLETYLGLPKAKRSGDKPLAVLSALFSGNIDANRLNRFCGKVEKLLE